jgi:SAM-dependent methyltransferase
VLEHVADDRRALSEIARVLRAGGRAVLQTPFSDLLTQTLEDPGLESSAARHQLFGQEDHVRLYGRDFSARALAAGLHSCGNSHAVLLPEIDPRQYGVNPREPLMLFRKDR